MNSLQRLATLALLLIGCTRTPDPAQVGTCPEDSHEGKVNMNKPGRGALLGTRFPSLEALKTVVRIEYSRQDSTNQSVRVYHCSGGKTVVSVLETGTSQGDILKARYGGAFKDRFKLLFNCPNAIRNRKDLEKVLYLSRWSPELFGEGDPAFFDIAKSMVANINTPELAFLNPRDSTEKGYLNTFNHITAQALITSCYSEELADFIADSHERYRHPELITGVFPDTLLQDLEEGPVDNYVDLVNNEWGQELGKQLQQKYGIDAETTWTPELLCQYLNDLQAYYSWAFQIGFEPYRPEDEEVTRFAHKIDAILNGKVKYKK